jgi:hypothetical protein
LTEAGLFPGVSHDGHPAILRLNIGLRSRSISRFGTLVDMLLVVLLFSFLQQLLQVCLYTLKAILATLTRSPGAFGGLLAWVDLD